jgi:hypothetical protein
MADITENPGIKTELKRATMSEIGGGRGSRIMNF